MGGVFVRVFNVRPHLLCRIPRCVWVCVCVGGESCPARSVFRQLTPCPHTHTHPRSIHTLSTHVCHRVLKGPDQLLIRADRRGAVATTASGRDTPLSPSAPSPAPAPSRPPRTRCRRRRRPVSPPLSQPPRPRGQGGPGALGAGCLCAARAAAVAGESVGRLVGWWRLCHPPLAPSSLLGGRHAPAGAAGVAVGHGSRRHLPAARS